MDALFVKLLVIILISILYPARYSTILYNNKRNERRPANRKGDTP